MTVNDLTRIVVPLPLAITSLMVAGGGFYWLANVEARLHQIEISGSPQIVVLTSRLAGLEAAMTGMRLDFDRLDRTIERNNNNQPQR